MSTFPRAFARLAIIAAAGFALLAVGPVPPTRAADLAVPGPVAPGTLYELGSFERRGVTILDGGTLEIRADGCWRSDYVIVNGNPDPRTVSVSYVWFDGAGNRIATVNALNRVELPPGVRTPVAANGCSGAVAANYGTLARTSAVRLMSVR